MVAVLFVRKDSIYKKIPGCNCYDIEKNALNFHGGMPIIAHPPCRGWGTLRRMAKPVPGETELAIWVAYMIRQEGGILEHPGGSKLWDAIELPKENEGKDKYGGWTLRMPQFWWGHSANKDTRFYIVGIDRKNLPVIPFKLGEAPSVICHSHKCRRRPEIKCNERNRTPWNLATWLVKAARGIKNL